MNHNDLTGMSDEDLVRHFQKEKDKHSFDEIYRRHHLYVLRILTKFLGQHSYEAEDLAQDLWIRIWNKLDTFKFKSKLETWMYTVALNEARAYLRSGWVAKSTHLEEEVVDLLGMHNDSPLKMCVREEMILLVSKAIDKLKERNREVMLLWLRGHSYKQIAVLLNIRIGTVMSRLNRAREELEYVYVELKMAS